MLLRTSLFPGYWKPMAFAIGCALFVWLAYPYAIEENKQFLMPFFTSEVWLYNAGALLILESLLLLGSNLWQLRILFGDLSKRRLWYTKLMDGMRYLPGLFFFFALFYLEVRLFLSIDNWAFESLTLIYAVVLFFGIWGISGLISRLFPEQDLRIELSSFFLLLQLLIAVVLTAMPGVNGYMTTETVNVALSWQPLLGWLALLAIGWIAGYFGFQKKSKKRIKL